MIARPTPIEGLVVLEPKVWSDERGFFMETFKEPVFRELGLPTEFRQDNFSRSPKGTLRGLHFQVGASAQGKLVRVSRGLVWDVAVDLRPGSKTFGQWYGVELGEENKRAFYVPEGFAHGFCVLSDIADFQYKCTQIYDPKSESGVVWNDPDLAITWPVAKPLLSEKDAKLPSFADVRRQLGR